MVNNKDDFFYFIFFMYNTATTSQNVQQLFPVSIHNLFLNYQTILNCWKTHQLLPTNLVSLSTGTVMKDAKSQYFLNFTNY